MLVSVYSQSLGGNVAQVIGGYFLPLHVPQRHLFCQSVVTPSPLITCSDLPCSMGCFQPLIEQEYSSIAEKKGVIGMLPGVVTAVESI